MLLLILIPAAFTIGYYIGKISVLKETKKAFEDFNEKITFDPKKRK